MTYEEVSALFRELAQEHKEAVRRLQETERLMKEASKETDRAFRETDRKFQETERLMKERSDETDRKIKEVSIQIGHLGNRLGDFVEEMVRPAAVRLFRERGLEVHQVIQDLTCYDDQGQYRSQVDLLVIDGNVAVAIECKSQLTVVDVDEHLERLDLFKDCFPQYAGMDLLGAVAAMVLPDDLGRYAYRQGLFVLAQSGDAVIVRNDEAFRPRQW